jgi:predicted transcriptional regulator
VRAPVRLKTGADARILTLEREAFRGLEYPLTCIRHDKLSLMDAAQGRATEALMQQAVERLLSHEEWFSQKGDKGLAAADRGEFVEHDDVCRMIETPYPA